MFFQQVSFYIFCGKGIMAHFQITLLGRGLPNLNGKEGVKSSGLNFTNVLRTAFTLADPESVKIYL